MEQLRLLFPDVDDENLEETLDACEGDAAQAATVLEEVLAEEQADTDRSMSLLSAVLDATSRLVLTAPEQQPAEERARLLRLCESLNRRGVRLLRPVLLLLDGVRDAASLLSGLDEADAMVVRQMMRLVDEPVEEPSAPAEAEVEPSPSAEGEVLDIARLVSEFEEVLAAFAVRLEHAPQHRDTFVARVLEPLQEGSGVGLLHIVQRLWRGERDANALLARAAGADRCDAAGDELTQIEQGLVGRLLEVAASPELIAGHDPTLSDSKQVAALRAHISTTSEDAERLKESVKGVKAQLIKLRMAREADQGRGDSETIAPAMARELAAQ